MVAWGLNADGQTSVPPDLTNAVAIAGGGAHSLAIRTDGTVVAWGLDGDGQTNVPSGLTNALAIAVVLWTVWHWWRCLRASSLHPKVKRCFRVQMPPLGRSNRQVSAQLPVDLQHHQSGRGRDRLADVDQCAAAGSGNYAVLVSDDAGSVTSIVASLTRWGASFHYHADAKPNGDSRLERHVHRHSGRH